MSGSQPVGIVGAGVIGMGWAAHFLRFGHTVVVEDPDKSAGERLRAELEASWPLLEELGLTPGAGLHRLRVAEDLHDLCGSSSVIFENAPERLDLKQKLIARIDEFAPPEVAIASSSSSFKPSDLQSQAQRHPERILVAHPFHPPHLIPLVELVPGRATSHATVVSLQGLLRETGKVPIVLQAEVLGHVANRLQAAMWREAYSLVDRGVASVADIDLAVSFGPGLRWAFYGPFATLALSGGSGGIEGIHDHLGATMSALWADQQLPILDDALKAKVEAGTKDELAGADLSTVQAIRDSKVAELLRMRRVTTTTKSED